MLVDFLDLCEYSSSHIGMNTLYILELVAHNKTNDTLTDRLGSSHGGTVLLLSAIYCV